MHNCCLLVTWLLPNCHMMTPDGQMRPHNYCQIVTWDHVIVDGWSHGIEVKSVLCLPPLSGVLVLCSWGIKLNFIIILNVYILCRPFLWREAMQWALLCQWRDHREHQLCWIPGDLGSSIAPDATLGKEGRGPHKLLVSHPCNSYCNCYGSCSKQSIDTHTVRHTPTLHYRNPNQGNSSS